MKKHNIENYPPGNLHEDDSPFPMVGYVSFLEGIENIPKKSLNVSLVVRILVDCNFTPVFWWSGMPDFHLGPGFMVLLTLELLYL